MNVSTIPWSFLVYICQSSLLYSNNRQSTTDMLFLSNTNLFTYSRILCKWSHHGVWSGFFHWADYFEIHPCFCSYQHFIPFYCWVLFSGMNVTQFVYLFISSWTFSLSFQLFRNSNLWMRVCFHFYWANALGVELLRHYYKYRLYFLKNCQTLPKWFHYFTFPKWFFYSICTYCYLIG